MIRSQTVTQLEANVVNLVKRNAPIRATKGAHGTARLAPVDDISRGITDAVVTAEGLVGALNGSVQSRLTKNVAKAASIGIRDNSDAIEAMSDALLHTLVKKMVADPRCLVALRAALKDGP